MGLAQEYESRPVYHVSPYVSYKSSSKLKYVLPSGSSGLHLEFSDFLETGWLIPTCRGVSCAQTGC